MSPCYVELSSEKVTVMTNGNVVILDSYSLTTFCLYMGAWLITHPAEDTYCPQLLYLLSPKLQYVTAVCKIAIFK